MAEPHHGWPESAVEKVAQVIFEEQQDLDQDNGWDELPDEWREAWKAGAIEVLFALEPYLAAHDRAVKAEAEKAVVARVRSVFNMQCPPMDPDSYVDRGAYLAHDWWNTVLGGLLDEMEKEATDD